MDVFSSFLEDYQRIIPGFREYLLDLEKPLPVYFRINTIKTGIEEAKILLEREGIEFQDTCFRELLLVKRQDTKRPLLSYHLGHVYPQALSSCLPVHALAPQTGERVLDLCAAPGGKTTHMAQLMADSGLILANDRKLGRLTALMANIKRMGVTNTIVTQARGEHYQADIRFDRVLVDAPCSGIGRYRIDDAGRIRHMRRGKTDLPAIQKALITRGFDLLRPGGVLVYSTCTLNVEENEAVVQYLLEKRAAEVTSWEPPVPWSPGITEFKGKEYEKGVGLARRFYPHRIHSVGFFLARIVKV